MQKAIVFGVLFFGFLSPSFGQKKLTPADIKEIRRNLCAPEKHVKKHVIKRVMRIRARVRKPRVSSELLCYRRGGKWQDGLCYKQAVPPSAPVRKQGNSPIMMKQEQNIILQPAESKSVLSSPAYPSSVSPSVDNKNEKWWWMGPGIWAMGLWAGEQDFVTGPYGTLIFAINHRFRVAGNVGAGFGPWHKNGITDVLVGGYGAVRAYKGLFIDFGIETVWGGFDGLSVHRRMFAVSAGPEYWFGDRASIGLRFLVGVRDNVTDCELKKGQIAGGNIFTSTLYF